MGLEKDLAEIEVLADEVIERAVLAWQRKNKPPYLGFDEIEKGVKLDPSLIIEKYRKAKKAMAKGDTTKASLYLTEFSEDAKNLLNNLALLSQAIYGKEKPEIKRDMIKTNIIDAPRSADGRTLAEIMAAHDYSKTSLNKILRDMKTHGRGYSAITLSGNVVAKDFFKKQHPAGEFNDFIDGELHKYVDITKTVLRTIAEGDTEKLVPRDEVMKKSVLAKRLVNWKDRHIRPIKVALASAVIGAGIIGIPTYQNITEKKNELKQAEQIKRILATSYAESTDNWARGLGEKTFNEVRDSLNERTKYIGINLERELKDNVALRKVLGSEYKTFESERKDFNARLSRLKYDRSNSTSTVKSLAELSNLLKEEQSLIEADKKLTQKIKATLLHGFGYTSSK